MIYTWEEEASFVLWLLLCFRMGRFLSFSGFFRSWSSTTLEAQRAGVRKGGLHFGRRNHGFPRGWWCIGTGKRKLFFSLLTLPFFPCDPETCSAFSLLFLRTWTRICSRDQFCVWGLSIFRMIWYRGVHSGFECLPWAYDGRVDVSASWTLGMSTFLRVNLTVPLVHGPAWCCCSKIDSSWHCCLMSADWYIGEADIILNDKEENTLSKASRRGGS